MAYRVAHPALVRVDAELSEVLADPGPTLLVLLVGPTGVGKTTLLQALTARILEREADDLRRNPARIPIAGLSVIQTENGRFDEADYYRRALAALHEPLIQRKIAAHDFASNPLLKPPPRLASVADLRRLLERVLVWRGPLAFWLDNAHALASGWVEQRLEWLRSLADATNTPHGLAGTYDLLHLWNLNGQLGRRSHDIHFGRYHLDRATDQDAFLRVLVSFEQQLPEGTNLLDGWELLYERSIGCVGIIKDWLTLAYRTALKAGSETVTGEHVERTAPPPDKAWRQLEEASLGERRLSTRTEARSRLRIALGLEEPPSTGASVVPEAGEPPPMTAARQRPRRAKPATARRPGERRAVRDPAYTMRQGPRLQSETTA
jgi:energy-coupling factor transporter ATP-binding protein EcfA2